MALKLDLMSGADCGLVPFRVEGFRVERFRVEEFRV